MPKLPPHPQPPTDPSVFKLPLVELNHAWWRSHSATREAIFFGRSGDNRYDAPNREYGIMYLAHLEAGAFVEAYLRNPRGAPVCVSAASLAQRHFTTIVFASPLRLVDLTGPGLARLGADARLTTGDPALSQKWALAFWNHPDRPDGVLYRSRHDQEMLCCGVFDRRQDARPGHSLGSLIAPSNARLLGEILDRYGVALLT